MIAGVIILLEGSTSARGFPGSGFYRVPEPSYDWPRWRIASSILIDGNSLAYRAFFALPDTIATSRGEPTNAIFGFASMLVKILTEYGPKATIVVWDAGMSGREQEYEPYKAERKSRPDLLRDQWPHFEPLVEAFGYENVRVEGFEADDVIASLAEQAKEAGIPVMIVTGDRDAYQLAENGSVRVMTTSRGITDTRVYDREGVVERYGMPPELVTDFIGLKGDTSDNIPGVPGIGDKTAAQLLQQYGSLEEVLAHIDDISGAKRKENLRENADLARLSKKLATLQRDIDAGVDVTEIADREPDRSQLREVFNRFELRDPLRRLEEALGEQAAAPRAAGRAAGGGDGAPGLAVRAAGRPGRAGRSSVTTAPCDWAAAVEGRGPDRDGRVAARRGTRPGRRARLEVDCPCRRRRGRHRDAAGLGHDGRRLPDRPGAAALSARRAGPGGEHRGGRRGRCWRARRCEVRALCEGQQPEIDRLELRGLLEDDRAAAGRGALPARAPGREARHLPAGRDRGARVGGDRGARAPDLGAGGRGVHDRFAAAALRRSCSRSSS